MREIYFKIKQNCELPKARLTYSYKDFNGMIHPFNDLCVDFKEDENNIKQMEAIKEKYAQFFMFFNNSDEGIEFWKNNPIRRIMKPKFLVRPNDFSIFELDESNGCYRTWSKNPITYSDGTRPTAMKHFTLENLTKNYGFFVIEQNEIEKYNQKNHEYYKFLSWQCRSDGHGGSKGGTYEQYLATQNKKLLDYE